MKEIIEHILKIEPRKLLLVLLCTLLIVAPSFSIIVYYDYERFESLNILKLVILAIIYYSPVLLISFGRGSEYISNFEEVKEEDRKLMQLVAGCVFAATTTYGAIATNSLFSFFNGIMGYYLYSALVMFPVMWIYNYVKYKKFIL